MTTCKHCETGVQLEGKDHWLVKSIVPARIKIVRCGHLKDKIEWSTRSEGGVSCGGFQSRAAAQRSADNCNREAPEQRWRIEKTVIEAPTPSTDGGGG